MAKRSRRGRARAGLAAAVVAMGMLATATGGAARIHSEASARERDDGPSRGASTRARRAGLTAALAVAASTGAPSRSAPPTDGPRPDAETGRAATQPAAAPRLRRLRGAELNPALVERATEIIRRHHQDPFGTEIPFTIEGRTFVGRIERHYHPEGGPLRPWGYHAGCSLFAVESE
jgi:hypothetical protein